MKYTTRLCFRSTSTHKLEIVQNFCKEFSRKEAAEKFIEKQAENMRAVGSDISVFGQVIDENGNIATGIMLL